MKKQFNCRISAATRIKLNYLTTLYGTQTEAISVAIDRLHQSHKEIEMDIQALIKRLEFEYYATLAANPKWNTTLWDYLISAGIPPDNIWEYSPEIGRHANQLEPDWL